VGMGTPTGLPTKGERPQKALPPHKLSWREGLEAPLGREEKLARVFFEHSRKKNFLLPFRGDRLGI